MKEIAGKFGLFTSKSLDIGGRKKSQTYTSCLLFNLLLLFINVLCFLFSWIFNFLDLVKSWHFQEIKNGASHEC